VSDLFRPDVALEMERRRWDRRESGRRASDMEQSLIAAPIPNA
jgi:hypothetical protein